jgi:hypothetical protein
MSSFVVGVERRALNWLDWPPQCSRGVDRLAVEPARSRDGDDFRACLRRCERKASDPGGPVTTGLRVETDSWTRNSTSVCLTAGRSKKRSTDPRLRRQQQTSSATRVSRFVRGDAKMVRRLSRLESRWLPRPEGALNLVSGRNERRQRARRLGHKAATTMLEATRATTGLHYSVTTLDGPK